jgi:hypothetical protein
MKQKTDTSEKILSGRLIDLYEISFLPNGPGIIWMFARGKNKYYG